MITFFMIWLGLNALMGIALIGAERRPFTKTDAVLGVAVNAFLIYMLSTIN